MVAARAAEGAPVGRGNRPPSGGRHAWATQGQNQSWPPECSPEPDLPDSPLDPELPLDPEDELVVPAVVPPWSSSPSCSPDPLREPGAWSSVSGASRLSSEAAGGVTPGAGSGVSVAASATSLRPGE